MTSTHTPCSFGGLGGGWQLSVDSARQAGDKVPKLVGGRLPRDRDRSDRTLSQHSVDFLPCPQRLLSLLIHLFKS